VESPASGRFGGRLGLPQLRCGPPSARRAALCGPVFDTAGRARLPIAAILAGADGDPRTAVARTQAVLCESGVLGGIRLASDSTTIVVRRVHPTADGVWTGFDAREELAHHGDRYLEVFVPWGTLWG